MSDQLNILIVEDEVLISERLRQIVKSLGHSVLDICGSLSDVQNYDMHNKPDLALLDIRMQGEDQGIEVAKIMNQHKVPFVFITSFSDKDTLQSAIIQGPKGYIVKPFSKKEMEEVLNKIIKEKPQNFLEIRSAKRLEKIPVEDIRWIKSENVYVEIHLEGEKIVVRKKLNEVEDLLTGSSLIRLHQSFIVNKKFVTKMDVQNVWINDNQFPVSKKYKAEFEKFRNNS